MVRSLAVAALLFVACKKDAPATPPAALKPTVVTVPGVLQAIQCADVTAEFLGDDPGDGAPKRFGINALRFRFGNGTVLPFMPSGTLEFSDWRFEVFSPTCEAVVLQGDHYGPLQLMKLSELRAVLERKATGLTIAPPKTEAARVIDDVVWKSGDALEFTASCCGGAEVFGASLSAPAHSVFVANEAPHGVRRTATGFEVVP